MRSRIGWSGRFLSCAALKAASILARDAAENDGESSTLPFEVACTVGCGPLGFGGVGGTCAMAMAGAKITTVVRMDDFITASCWVGERGCALAGPCERAELSAF